MRKHNNYFSRIKLLFPCLFLTFSVLLFGQNDVIFLINPSFEDIPKTGEPPKGWRNCAYNDESPPDVQPGSFKVITEAAKGATYLGMATRDNDTWERVGQKLSKPLKANYCYQFSVSLAWSPVYLSQSRTTGKPANYTQPVKLIIWGGDKYCKKKQRLGESPLISHVDWKEYSFKFTSQGQHNYILLEVFYKTPVIFPYNGHILIDNLSPITPVNCLEFKAGVPISKNESQAIGEKTTLNGINYHTIPVEYKLGMTQNEFENLLQHSLKSISDFGIEQILLKIEGKSKRAIKRKKKIAKNLISNSSITRINYQFETSIIK